jgi:nucleoside-triphosphatase THEP1
VGKTTVCQAVAELARRRGYRPDGVITPALYACPADWELGIGNWELMKVGFEAVDVGSGERWLLARTDPSTILRQGSGQALRQGSGQGSGHRRELSGPRVGPYSFDPAGLARALRVLRRAATAGCDLLMVDEIGPLELEQGQGFAPILDLIHWRSSRTCSAPAERETSPVLSTVEGFATPEENSEDSLSGERPMHTLIVVRPALVEKLRQRLGGVAFVVFNVTEENRDELPVRIVEELWGDG